MKPGIVYRIKSTGNYVKALDIQDIEGLFQYKLLNKNGISVSGFALNSRKIDQFFDQFNNKDLVEEVNLEILGDLFEMSIYMFKSLFPNFPHGQDAEVIIKSLINFQQLHLAIATYGTVDTYDILKEFRFNVSFKQQLK